MPLGGYLVTLTFLWSCHAEFKYDEVVFCCGGDVGSEVITVMMIIVGITWLRL